MKKGTDEFFAESIGCEISLLNRLSKLTDELKISQLSNLEKLNFQAQTDNGCNIGQYYKAVYSNLSEIGIWLGLYFPKFAKPLLVLKLFPLPACNSSLIGYLEKEKYTFTAEYSSFQNEGHWLSINLKSNFEKDEDVNDAKDEIKLLIDSFFGEEKK